MNKVYKHIWSKLQGRLVVVSECARGAQGRKSGRRKLTVSLIASSLLSGVAWANDLPSGGQIVSGAGSIASNGNSMTINQSSDRMIANWQSFSIGENNAVTFNQPGASAVALNRVVGQDPSQILGNLNANGQVFLLNPNGIAIGKTGSVQTGGFVASTLGMSNEDFLAGKYQFNGNGGTISNQGDISGSVVALIAPSVTNEGTITAGASSDSAPGVALAAGTDVLLDFDGDGLLSVEVKANTLAGLVENNGLIQADGGVAILTAKGASDVLKGVVNNSGTVQANSIAKKGGRILLLGDMREEHGEVNVAGTLSAEFVETSAATVNIDKYLKVDTHGGEWLIDPVNIEIDTAKASAIQTALGSGDVTVTTANGAGWAGETNGTGSDEGNITVNAAIDWAANTLTLRADNDITINAELTSTGTTASDGLVLQYAQTTDTGDYAINAPVNLAAGSQFQTQHASDAAITYTVITDIGVAGSTTGADLQGINGGLTGNYVLGADIDASATSGWNAGAGFDPLGDNSTRFTGRFDGLGHTVSDLTIDLTTDYVGLFGYVDSGGVVQNIGMVDGSISGKARVGGLVGRNNGTVSNAYATGSVSGTSNYVGGLVGFNDGTLSNAYATGDVSGSDYVGGLVGVNDTGATTISNSYATGSVSGSEFVGGLVGFAYGTISNVYATGSVTGSEKVGGLVGRNGDSGTISYAYATGSVSGTSSDVGGLVGRHSGAISNAYATGAVSGSSNTGGLVGFDGAGTITNGYYVAETTGQNDTGKGEALATIADLTAALPSGFDSAVWLRGHNGYDTSPYLLNVAPISSYIGSDTGIYTIIRTLTELQAAGDNLGINYALWNDIDASDTATWNAGAGFDPLGDNSSRFTGRFDGLDHTISELTINRPTEESIGLFGHTDGATISNVGLVGGSLVGKWFVGGLVGYNDAASSISNAYATGSMMGEWFVGGLVGYNDAASSISNAYATGSVSGGAALGGLVGYNDAASISSAYATGSVTGSGDHIGGLVGYNYNASISNAYATGSVTSDGDFIGGLVGYNDAASNISNAYATGSVTGIDDHIGGLVGYNDNATVTASFWNTETSTQPTGIGVDNNSQTVTGLSTIQMQDPFNFIDAGWDFASVWGKSNVSENNGYMMLRAVGEGSLYDDYVRLSDTNTAKTYGDDNPELSGITLDGVGTDNVSLAWYGLIAEATNAGHYAYGASVLDVTTTSANGVYVDYGAGALTIDKAALSVTANDANKTYDGLAFIGGNGVSYAGFVNGETDSVLGGSLAYGGTAQSAVNAGSYTLSASGLSADNYAISYTDGSLTVDKAALSVTANDANKTYDGLAFTGGNGVSYDGFVAGEDDSVLGGSLAYGGTAQSAVNAGTYTLTASGQTADNYSITYIGGTLAVDKAALIVTANDANKTYDGLAVNGGNGVTYAGFVAGEDDSVLGGTLAYGGTAQSAINAGTYTLTASGQTADNYSITYTGGTLAVDKAALNVTANDANKTYDGLAFNGGNGVSYAGFVTGEDESILGGTLAYGGDAQDAVNAGSYTLSASGLTADNYEIAYTDGTLTVDKAALTLTANDQSKTYGDAFGFAGTEFASVGLQNGETVGSVTLTSAATSTTANAGSHAITAASATGGTFDIGNYDVTYNTGSFTVDKAALTVTANDASKTYDGLAFTGGNGVTYSGFVNSETDSVLGGALTYGGTAQTAVNAGAYTLTASGQAADNYSITYIGGTLTVDKAALNVTANDANKTYDGLAFSGGNGVSYAGFVTGEDESILGGTLAYGGTAQSAINAGTYILTASGQTSDNYSITYTGGTLAVDKAALSVTTNDANKTYDGLAFNGGNGVSYAGFVTGEDESILGGTLAYGGDAQDAVNAGSYALSASGLTADNYEIAYTGGVLTVDKAALTLTANDQSKTYGDAFSFAGTEFASIGLQNGETVGSVMLASDATNSTASAGSHDITAASATGGTFDIGNYDVTYNAGSFTVDKAALTVTANDENKTYDGVAFSGGNGVTYSGFVNSETDSVLGGSLAYGGTAQSAVNAGSYRLTASGLTSGNYDFSYADGMLTVSKAVISAITGLTASDKVYDGTTVATLDTSAVGFSGLISGDSLTLASAAGAFTDKNAGTGKTVDITGLSLGGADVGNYTLASTMTSTTADIAKAAISVITGIIANGKIYDGTTFAALNTSGAGFTGMVEGDALTIASGKGAFGDADPGFDKSVAITGLSLGGSDAANYVLADTTAEASATIFAPLTATYLLPEQTKRTSLGEFAGRTETLLDPGPELIEVQAASDSQNGG